MAEFGTQETLTLEANADLSAKQYTFMKYVATEKADLATSATGTELLGVLQNKPQSGEFATVAYAGLSKLVAGGAITAGAILTTNTSGRAAAVASGQVGAARAISAAGADGEVITALLFPPVRWAGAA
jgi:hypothetical protein